MVMDELEWLWSLQWVDKDLLIRIHLLHLLCEEVQEDEEVERVTELELIDFDCGFIIRNVIEFEKFLFN